MSDKYNGWTNYETWRVNLEMIEAEGYYACLEDWKDTSTPEELKYDLAQVIKENCEEVIEMHGSDFTLDYALAFLDAVDWREIARHIVDDYLEQQ